MEDPQAREAPPCPICRSVTFIPELKAARDLIWRKPGLFDLQRCQGCNLVVTRPRPTKAALSFYYEDTYSGSGQDDMQHFQTESWIARKIAAYRLKVISKASSIQRGERVLDVGCSYGTFCRHMHDVLDCDVIGLDLDAHAIENAIERPNIDYRVGDLESVDLPVASFGLVTFMETLEHHRDPVDALRRAYALLKPGGLCVVEVPNYGGLWRRIFGRYWLPLLIPQHLFHFTSTSLHAAMASAGFKRILHHQTMFYPLEGVASFGLFLGKHLKSPPPGGPITWRTPFDIAIFLFLCVLYPLLEVPSQAVLRYLGLSGHQMIIAQREDNLSRSNTQME